MPTLPSDSGHAKSATEPPKGALLIRPIPVCALEDKSCPICHEAYTNPPDRNPEPDKEWAVRVEMVAEWFGPKRCCGHVLGRQCLERHLKTRGEWSNKCPICRDVWYHRHAPGGDEDISDQGEQYSGDESSGHPLRRSVRIAARASHAARNSQAQANRVARTGSDQCVQNLGKSHTQFTQKLFAALEVADGASEVVGSMEEVEQKLERLYRTLF